MQEEISSSVKDANDALRNGKDFEMLLENAEPMRNLYIKRFEDFREQIKEDLASTKTRENINQIKLKLLDRKDREVSNGHNISHSNLSSNFT